MLTGALCPTARVRVAQGVLRGCEPDEHAVTAFLGIAYAAPPVADLRFERPRAPAAWHGERLAATFGPRGVQRTPFADMCFRSSVVSEDCLYLNIWTPVPNDPAARLPVLLFVHGGAYLVGDGSEPRYDGARLAASGLVVVTLNIRLGIFGFFAHPQLGGANAGLFDLAAAMDWLQDNLDVFGGDANRITLGGSSSGGYAACALATCRPAKSQVAGIFAASAALLGASLSGLCAALPTLDDMQQRGTAFAHSIGAKDLQALKSLPAEVLLARCSPMGWSRPCLDGEFLRADIHTQWAESNAAQVPLLIGMTSAEPYFHGNARNRSPTLEAFIAMLKSEFGEGAMDVYLAYGEPRTATELVLAARDLAADRWIGKDNYQISKLAAAAGQHVYAYIFDHVRPDPLPGSGGWTSAEGAGHSTDIEYFLGTLALSNMYAWREEDIALSRHMQSYLIHFVQQGDPNAAGLAHWPRFDTNHRMVFARSSQAQALDGTSRRLTCLRSADASLLKDRQVV